MCIRVEEGLHVHMGHTHVPGECAREAVARGWGAEALTTYHLLLTTYHLLLTTYLENVCEKLWPEDGEQRLVDGVEPRSPPAHMCMCVCICVCMCICVCVHMCMYVHMYMYVYVQVHMRMRMYARVCMCICMRECACVHACVRACMRVHAHMCAVRMCA